MRVQTWGAMLGLLAIAATAPDHSFRYTYPAEVRAIPALRARLDAEAAKLHADSREEEAAERRERRRDHIPFNGWTDEYNWEVVTDTPRFLSLSETQSTYRDGPHPNEEFDALLWDKTTSIARDPESLFVSKPAFEAALREAFCDLLQRQQRARRRQLGGDDRADPCAGPFGVVLLGSSTRTRFDRIGFLIAPYEAGPYVEGDYSLTVPITPAILAAVRPEYRAYFAVMRQ